MPTLEKAFAKLDQNYQRIIGGMGAEGLRTLTGAPTTTIRNNGGANQAQTWAVLSELARRNYPMVAGCCNAGQLDGLISGHAYSLLDLHTLSNGVKLAQVRNPWGSESYHGAWSDKSSLWTEQFKREVNFKAANDGKFWMPWEKYVSLFSR